MPFLLQSKEGEEIAKSRKRKDVAKRIDDVFPVDMSDPHACMDVRRLFPVGIHHRQEQIEEVKELFKDAQI